MILLPTSLFLITSSMFLFTTLTVNYSWLSAINYTHRVFITERQNSVFSTFSRNETLLVRLPYLLLLVEAVPVQLVCSCQKPHYPCFLLEYSRSQNLVSQNWDCAMQSVKQNQKKTNGKLHGKWWWRAHRTLTEESFEVNTMKSSRNISHRILLLIQQLFHHFSRISQRFHPVLVSIGCLLRKRNPDLLFSALADCAPSTAGHTEEFYTMIHLLEAKFKIFKAD